MKFQEAIQSVFNHYADFSGRARRSEYWYFVVFNIAMSSIAGYVGRIIGMEKFLVGLYSLAVFVPTFSVMWRRLHDSGRSGLYVLFSFIPLIGWIILLVFMCQAGTPGPNQYGPDPRRDGLTF